MQVTIARQLGLDPSTVSNFFMNARRRSVDKWREDSPGGGAGVRAGSAGPGALVQSLPGTQAGDLSPGQLDL